MNIKKLILSALLAIGGACQPTQINAWFFGNNCCESYECGCNPLYCGAWSLQVQAGVAPVVWRHRGELNLVACASNSANPIFPLDCELPKFSKLFKTPWIVGGKIGYNLTENIEVYGEVNYLQSKHKDSCNSTFPILNVPGQSLVFTFGKYKLVDAYFGGRYYWDRWCNSVAFFLGAQVGLTSHRNTSTCITLNGSTIRLAANGCPGDVSNANCDENFFQSNTVVSGGLNLGLDYCICGNWSLVLTSEIIASCGPRTRTSSMFAPALPAPTLASNLLVGGIGTELRFPVTLGVRYTF